MCNSTCFSPLDQVGVTESFEMVDHYLYILQLEQHLPLVQKSDNSDHVMVLNFFGDQKFHDWENC